MRIKPGRSLTSYHDGQNRLDFGENYLIYCQSGLVQDNEKEGHTKLVPGRNSIVQKLVLAPLCAWTIVWISAPLWVSGGQPAFLWSAPRAAGKPLFHTIGLAASSPFCNGESSGASWKWLYVRWAALAPPHWGHPCRSPLPAQHRHPIPFLYEEGTMCVNLFLGR